MNKLSFLEKAGVTVNDQSNLSPEELEVATAQMFADEQEMTAIRNEIQAGHDGVEAALSAVDVALGLTANGVEAKLTSAVFAEQLALGGIPEVQAEVLSAGLENASTDDEVGNEALESAKDLVMNIVNWLIDQWQRLKALAKRTFAAKFGSIKRSLAAWRNTKSRIESYQEDGRTREDKSKLEIKAGAAYMVLGEASENPKNVLAWNQIPSKLELFEKIITKLTDDLSDDMVPDYGSLSEFSTTVTELKTKVTTAHSSATSFDTGANSKWSAGIPLLGRQVFIEQNRVDESELPSDKSQSVSALNAEDLRKVKKYLNGYSIGVRPCHVKLKSIDEVKVECATLDELDAVADAHIEMLTNALTLETSKKIGKIERAFDKAFASAKKWTKDTETDSAEDKRKAITGAGMMAAYLTVAQDASVGVISDVIGYASAVAKAHGAVASKCLGRYKKA